MSGILDISIAGLNNATARIANAASNIVNASSTTSAAKNSAPQDSISISGAGSDSLDGAIVDSITAQADYGANAAAIKIENKVEKSLLDIKT